MSNEETIAELKRQIWALDATVHNLRLKNEALQEAIVAKDDLISAQKDVVKELNLQLEAVGAGGVQALANSDKLQVIARQVLQDMQAQDVLHEWHDLLAEALIAPQQEVPAVQFDADGFRGWVLRNLPDDTIISNGAWWANHLTLWAQRFVNAAPQQEVQEPVQQGKWAWVPVEPSFAMLVAAHHGQPCDFSARKVWQDMLDALLRSSDYTRPVEKPNAAPQPAPSIGSEVRKGEV